ncbi:hypothetical protein L1887_21109 [Cichorium endivia]|nr:hypothetical protein L1887_21109 [Cichorium endivia]
MCLHCPYVVTNMMSRSVESSYELMVGRRVLEGSRVLSDLIDEKRDEAPAYWVLMDWTCSPFLGGYFLGLLAVGEMMVRLGVLLGCSRFSNSV